LKVGQKNIFVEVRIAMIFSKSFGYAVRGMLYVALMQNEKRYVQVEEIATTLAVPRHFMGKIMKNLVKERLLASSKGPSGGFALHESSLSTPLVKIAGITEGADFLKKCVLRVKECNSSNPCPLHFQMEVVKFRLQWVLSGTTISDLLNGERDEMIKSIATSEGLEILMSENKEIN
jgi:Rrf2 family transcriptional regulator, iron-sulfur cluster assembly transcription factor